MKIKKINIYSIGYNKENIPYFLINSYKVFTETEFKEAVNVCIDKLYEEKIKDIIINYTIFDFYDDLCNSLVIHYNFSIFGLADSVPLTWNVMKNKDNLYENYVNQRCYYLKKYYSNIAITTIEMLYN